MVDFVIDIEAFQGKNGETVVKELSVAPVYSSEQSSYVFRPPYPYRELGLNQAKTNRWLRANMHRYPWWHGDIPYSRLPDILADLIPEGSTVYAKGDEKCAFIEDMLPDRLVVELDSIGCPRVAELINGDAPFCPDHADGYHCARVKAFKFARWCYEQFLKISDDRLVKDLQK